MSLPSAQVSRTHSLQVTKHFDFVIMTSSPHLPIVGNSSSSVAWPVQQSTNLDTNFISPTRPAFFWQVKQTVFSMRMWHILDDAGECVRANQIPVHGVFDISRLLGWLSQVKVSNNPCLVKQMVGVKRMKFSAQLKRTYISLRRIEQLNSDNGIISSLFFDCLLSEQSAMKAKALKHERQRYYNAITFVFTTAKQLATWVSIAEERELQKKADVTIVCRDNRRVECEERR